MLVTICALIAVVTWFGFKEIEYLKSEVNRLETQTDLKAQMAHNHFSEHSHHRDADLDHAHKSKHEHRFEYAKVLHEHPPHLHSYAEDYHDHDNLEKEIKNVKLTLSSLSHKIEEHTGYGFGGLHHKHE